MGAGSVGGSVIGGRWSDHVMTKMKNENGGIWYPEVGAPDFENETGIMMGYERCA